MGSKLEKQSHTSEEIAEILRNDNEQLVRHKTMRIEDALKKRKKAWVPVEVAQSLEGRLERSQKLFPKHDPSQSKNCIDCAFFDMPPSYGESGFCNDWNEKYWVWAEGCSKHQTRKEVWERLNQVQQFLEQLEIGAAIEGISKVYEGRSTEYQKGFDIGFLHATKLIKQKLGVLESGKDKIEKKDEVTCDMIAKASWEQDENKETTA